MPLKLVKPKKEESYSEEGQFRPCKFSFALLKEDEVHQLHSGVLCRDFLADTLIWRESKTTGKIYGYSYAGPVDTEVTRLYISNGKHLKENLKFLNSIEESAGYKPTKIYDVGFELMTVGDPEWMKNTIAFSFYTWLLRLCTWPKIEKWEDLDKVQDQYFGKPYIRSVVEKLPKAFKLLPDKGVMGALHTAYMHSLSGFVAALTDSSSTNRYAEDLKKALDSV